MLYHYIEQDIDDEMVEKIITPLNQFPDCHHVFFLSSQGGNIPAADVIKEILESYNKQDGQRVEVVFNNFVFSATLRLMFSLDRDIARYMSRGISLMAHQTGMVMRIMSNGKGSYGDHESRRQYMIDSHEEEMNMLQGWGFTKKQISYIESGNDLYIHGEEALRIIRKNKIKEYNG